MSLTDSDKLRIRAAFANEGTSDRVIAVLEGAIGQDLTITDGENLILGSTTGTKIGTATTQKLAFFNSTPVVQPASAAQAAAVAASGGDSPTEAEFNAVVTLVNRLRTDLIALGLIKGSA
jgi:hypothetical protein